MKRVILVALVVAACGKAEDPRPVASTAPPHDGVQVLSPGAPATPRLLRYQLVKGDKSQLELAMSLDMDAGGRGGKLPSIVMTVEIAVEDVLPDGSAHVRTTIVEAHPRERPGSITPSPVMGQMTAALAGVAFTATLSPTGTLRDAKADVKQLPAPLAAQIGQLTQSLEQLAMPLPDQPVGVGAKWSTRKTAKQDGLELVTVTTIEVTAIDAERVTFASTSTISAKDQTITNAGQEVQIKDLGGGGSAKGTLDLAHMTIVGQFDLELRGIMTAMGQTAPMKMAMAMTMSPPQPHPGAPQGEHSAP